MRGGERQSNCECAHVRMYACVCEKEGDHEILSKE